MKDRRSSVSLLRESGKGIRPLLLLFLAFSLYLVYMVLRPFIATIIFAAVLALLFQPLKRYLLEGATNRLYRGNETAAAFTVALLIAVFIVIPLFVFAGAVVKQGVESVNTFTAWIDRNGLQEMVDSPRITSLLGFIRKNLPFQVGPGGCSLSSARVQLP